MTSPSPSKTPEQREGGEVRRPGQEVFVNGEWLFVVRAADYARLLEASEGDDMLIRCDHCGAWLDLDDPATASVGDVQGCWHYATGRDADAHLCRRDRVCEAIAKEALPRWKTYGGFSGQPDTGGKG